MEKPQGKKKSAKKQNYNCITKRFKRFARSTTLHGWSYIEQSRGCSWDSMLWISALVAFYIISVIFAVNNTSQYINSGMKTTIESTTDSLKKVYFPAITICNINQVEASILVRMGVYGNLTKMDAIYNEYIVGFKAPFHDDTLSSIDWLRKHNLKYGMSFSEYAHQPCNDLIVDVEFQKRKMYWHDFQSKHPGPVTVGTDYGVCCTLAPQIHLNEELQSNVTMANMYHKHVYKGANNGENKGMSILIDVENFNFGYHKVGMEGAKLAVHDHRNKPIMSQQGVLINPGKLTRLLVRPNLYYTTDDALAQMRPVERQCYTDKEVNLTYLPWSMGFRYDLSNCLVNAALKRTFTVCNCTPFFHPSDRMNVQLQQYPFCTGDNLNCMWHIIENIGDEEASLVADHVNVVSGYNGQPCLARCHNQENNVELSSTSYPQSGNFVMRPTFCKLAQKLLNGPCENAKKKFIDDQHPNLCQMLRSRKNLLTDCSTWPEQFFKPRFVSLVPFNRTDFSVEEADANFTRAMQNYAQSNLARVVILIRDPFVQTIKRDVAMTITNFVANTGGLLGLFLGFSFVSAVELIYHCFLKRT